MTILEILWDEWGVPHIFATTDPEAFRALGWAQMRAHGELFLKLYAQARGCAAEIWGEDYLESDKFVRRMGIPSRAKDWAMAQTPIMLVNLEAFVQGVNDFGELHSDQLSGEARAVLPIVTNDVFAHIQRVYAVYLTQGGQRPSGAQRNEVITPKHLVPGVHPIGTGIAGSNAWVLGGSRTASGKPILLANPHLYWGDLFTFFEVHQVVQTSDSTSSTDLYGVVQVGWPVLRYGFNPYLGWAHTVNALKGWDAFALELVGDGYVLGGQRHAFETHSEVIRVRTGSEFREETLNIRHSLHGPVIGEQHGKPIAARSVGFEVSTFSGIFEQYWKMANAKTQSEFQAALELHQNPLFTVLYADREGHIAHYFGGFVPRRTGKSWNDWVATLPGNDPSLIWTEVHDFSELPRVIDPPSDWLQNANNPPWTTTIPMVLSADHFPAYMTPRLVSMRELRSISMISGLHQATLSDVGTLIGSTYSELAGRVLPALFEAVRSSGSTLARDAARVLERWDRSFDPHSIGADLFSRFVVAMLGIDPLLADFWDQPWTEADPLGTPHGLKRPELAVKLLEREAARLRASTGSLERRWGDLTRLKRGAFEAQAHGHLDPFGVFRVSGYAKDQPGQFTVAFGTTYVAMVEFTTPVRAQVLLSYGNSSQPGSKHDGDQLPLLASRQMRQAWLSRDDIEAHLEFRESL